MIWSATACTRGWCASSVPASPPLIMIMINLLVDQVQGEWWKTTSCFRSCKLPLTVSKSLKDTPWKTYPDKTRWISELQRVVVQMFKFKDGEHVLRFWHLHIGVGKEVRALPSRWNIQDNDTVEAKGMRRDRGTFCLRRCQDNVVTYKLDADIPLNDGEEITESQGKGAGCGDERATIPQLMTGLLPGRPKRKTC